MAEVTSRVETGVYIITLNRPEKLNALNSSAWILLKENLDTACSGSYRGVVVTGTGRAFSSGDDIYEMYGLDEKSAREFFGRLAEAVDSIIECRKPIVTALNGLAAGGGAEILLLMDAVVAARGTWISFPESKIGLIPPILLSAGIGVVGAKRARFLALTGSRIPVEEAMAMGIVDLVVEPQDVLSKSVELALQLSDVPEEVLRIVRNATLAPYKDGIQHMINILTRLVTGGEAKKRMRMFIEGRSRS